MLREPPAAARELKTLDIHSDLVVVGAGIAGCCAAISAARAGLKVTLVQDRPVPGGNASSEVRLWILGATCHMGSNNRWAREGGPINELMLENLYRNPEGNPLIFDTVLLEMLVQEKNITLLLNTAAYECTKVEGDADRIASVTAFCSQNSTRYRLHAPLFADASGDGILGFLAGAAFRMGAESKDEFGEMFAPSGEFGHLLGHSLYFYSKDVGKPVTFTPPSFAMKNIPERIPRYRSFNTKEHGCKLWWVEWGGRLDTVHETENIKWELWKVVYGIWDYIKNSGNFPEAANLTLEWVGHIPGKRESRRFEGPYMLTQHDIVKRPHHDDAVAFGGWSIDLHPADGVFSPLKGSHHLHSKGVYTIPYRCYFSRNVKNLFIAGRIISATHVAFGTIRVMATGGHGGQAVGEAAALCKKFNCLPTDILKDGRIRLLQHALMQNSQHIPGVSLDGPADLARSASITASSELKLGELPAADIATPLAKSVAQLLPVQPGKMPRVTLNVRAAQKTTLNVELRTTSRPDHFTPDVVLATKTVELAEGQNSPTVDFGVTIDAPRYVFVCLMQNEHVSAVRSSLRVTGLLSVFHQWNEKTSAVGGEDYEVWPPVRRPDGHNLALKLDPPLAAFAPANLTNGLQRPTNQANAWVASPSDASPRVSLKWDSPQKISRVEVFFDPDYDHALETVLMGHPERAVPFMVKHFRIRDAARGNVLLEDPDNHTTRRIVQLDTAVTTTELVIEALATHGGRDCPPAIFEVRCYA